MSNRHKTRQCTIPSCSRPIEAKGWCAMHRARWRKHGDPVAVVRDYRGSWVKRLLETGWTVNEYGCCLWNGARNNGGYGTLSAQGWPGGRILAHVAAWMLTRGRPVPKGMQIAHTCTFKHCIRHTYLTTPSQNMRDVGRQRRAVVAFLMGTDRLVIGRTVTPDQTKERGREDVDS